MCPQKRDKKAKNGKSNNEQGWKKSVQSEMNFNSSKQETLGILLRK